MGREVLLKEWERACRSKGISYRLGKKHGFHNLQDLKKEASLYNHRVVSVELDGFEDVYNGTVDEFHNFFVGGWESKSSNGKRKWIYVNNKNCGEIILCANDSCRLLLLNLFSYVLNAFKGGKFDFKSFYQDAQIAQRLMDDLIDLELECLERIVAKIDSDPEPQDIKERERSLWLKMIDICRKGRRTGTGITALGDAIAACGIKYGTEESITLAAKIYQTLKFGAFRASVEMAKELGPFPVWNHELEKDNPFLLRIKEESLTFEDGTTISGRELWEDMKKYGRRNISLLTTAPAGTVSILTQTTSGIEPLFMIGYKRRKKVNPNDANVRIDFVDTSGDAWQEFTVYHPKVKEWMEATGETDVTKSPWHECCAEDLDWVQRVKMQAACQRNIDHSLSSTINLPEDVPVEKVAEIYETAWRYGCKGITVYRKNCRTGVLVEDNKKETKEDIIEKLINLIEIDTQLLHLIMVVII
jgi:ribonucleoside-diphosphate reductase alpha chain